VSAPEPVAATKVAYSRTYKGKLVASRIPDEDLARIDELAAAQGITRPDWIRQAVAEALDRA